MSENKDIQGKSTQSIGLKKSIHKSVLKDGEYHHLKNGIPSSFEGDIPFIQNAPSNIFCADLPKGYKYIGSKFVLEKDFHIVFLANSTNNKSEIGFFYPKTCSYTRVINENCLNFKTQYPIKARYKYIDCELHVYFQDGFNRNRHINLDNLPYVKVFNNTTGCLTESTVFNCSVINIQNDLTPPVVHPKDAIEAGALYTGAYQFAVCYANINGDAQSSYYSKTNPFPIYEDAFGGFKDIEGSKPNQLTNKAILVEFSNLDINYEYINLAVIKTVQGTPTYELVVTLPTTTQDYLYTGRELTKLLSIDSILGLYPDYYNSKTITSANNYLIAANMSTQDEANYQPFANLIELEWIAVRKKADTFSTSYKNPMMSVDYKGYQRGEVYAFGIQFLLSNGRKTSVFHIPGRKANSSELVKYTVDNIPSGQTCNFYEFQTNRDSCDTSTISELYHWQVYDTSTITKIDETTLTKCSDEVIAYGDFAYWESTDNYPCNDEVWGKLTGQKIRHHKFPTNNTIHHHNQPYEVSGYNTEDAFENNNTYIYPIGFRVKKDLSFYIKQAVTKQILTQEEADLIVGYEFTRGDRTGNKSIIAKGLFYNSRYYFDTNPDTNLDEKVLFPNYPFNDLRPDNFLTEDVGAIADTIEVSLPSGTTITPGETLLPGIAPYSNPFSINFTMDNINGGSSYVLTEDATIIYKKIVFGVNDSYSAKFLFFGQDDVILGDILLEYGSSYARDPLLRATYEKDTFTFHSPDTHFRKPFLGQEIDFHTIEFGSAKGSFYSVSGHPKFKPAPNTDEAQYALAYKAIGDYNNHIQIPLEDRRREIRDSMYLVANNYSKLQSIDYRINNRFRESSAIFKLNCQITEPNVISPFVRDNSRYTVDCDCKSTVENRAMNSKNAFEVNTQCAEDYRKISSYYGSLKAKIPNQYGQINTVKYLLTGTYNNVHDKNLIFGGDTFITRFSLKRKNSFFNVNFIGQIPVGVDYSEPKYANLLYPVYYLSNESGKGRRGEYTVDYRNSELDCNIDGGTATTHDKNGFFYLFSTGIVDFFVESEINTELRYSGANIQDTWYPKLKGLTNPWDWMEEEKVSINLDNTYFYNFDYSKANSEEALFPQAIDFKPNLKCKNTHPRRIVYSKQSNQETSADSWLIFPANNYYDGDSNLGDIIDIEAIDSFRVLVRYENGTQIFNAYDTLQLAQTSVTVGTGGMFQQRPQTFAETDTGYAGSQSKWAFNTSEMGSFYLDAKRGKVFNYNSQLEEISNNGMFQWFAENLEFKIKQQIPNVNTDNPFNGIGYLSIFDNKLKLWFLTKRDFKLKNLKDLQNITFDSQNNILYKGVPADFNNEKIWKNIGWTISYSPNYKSWQSYHSFIPNFYICDTNDFYSGIQNDKIYKHWDKFSFQTYYDKVYPFEVMLTTSKEELTSILQSIEYNLKVQKYLNNNYQDLYENHKINFNKAIISTDNQSSGLMNLIRKDNQNPYQSLQYPKPNTDSIDILYSKIEGHKYRINQFADLVLDKNNNVPIFLHDENGVDSVTNNIEYGKQYPQKLRNEFFDVTLINDKLSEYKFILKSLINKTLKSIR